MGCVVCLWGACESVRGREMYCVVPHSHVLWTLVCPLSLLQGTIKLTFADQHSQQTDHLDAYKPKPEIKVCMQFRGVKCGVVCAGGLGVVWCGGCCVMCGLV